VGLVNRGPDAPALGHSGWLIRVRFVYAAARPFAARGPSTPLVKVPFVHRRTKNPPFRNGTISVYGGGRRGSEEKRETRKSSCTRCTLYYYIITIQGKKNPKLVNFYLSTLPRLGGPKTENVLVRNGDFRFSRCTISVFVTTLLCFSLFPGFPNLHPEHPRNSIRCYILVNTTETPNWPPSAPPVSAFRDRPDLYHAIDRVQPVVRCAARMT
jgi:hypothetical protein